MSELNNAPRIKPSTNQRMWIFWLTSFSYFMVWFDENIFANLTPYWSEHFALSTAEIASITSAYLIGYFPTLFLAGVLSDRTGPRFTMMLSIFGCGSLSLLILIINDPTLLFWRNVIFGIFFGFCFAPCNKILTTWTNERERTFKVSIWNSFGVGSGSLAGPVALFIANRSYWLNAFVVIGVFSVVLFAFMIPKLKNHPEEMKGIAQDEIDYLNEKSVAEMEAEAAAAKKVTWGEALEPCKHLKTWMMGLVISLIIGPTYVSVMWASMFMIKELGIHPETAGIMIGIFAVTPFIFLLTIPIMQKVFKGSIRKMFAFACIISSAGYILGALLSLPPFLTAWLTCCLCYLVNPYGWGSVASYWAKTQKVESLGTVNGIGAAGCTIVGLLLMRVSGNLIGDQFIVAGAGEYTMLWLVTGLVMLTTLIPLAFCEKVHVNYEKGSINAAAMRSH